MVASNNHDLVIIVENMGDSDSLLALTSAITDLISQVDKNNVLPDTFYYAICLLEAMLPSSSQIKLD